MTSRREMLRLGFAGWSLFILGLVVLVAGCGGGGDGGRTGILRVALTDNASDYASVVVAVREIRLVPAGQEDEETAPILPVVVNFDPPVQYDVMQLAYSQQVLGEAVVPAGIYNQLRLVLAPNPQSGEPLNYITLKSDPTAKIALHTPSGQQSGLKIVGRFEVAAGTINAIALDFDPDKAIVEAGASGRYNLKPTGIRIVQMAQVLPQYGSLSGSVAPEDAWPTAVVYVFPQGSSSPVASGSVNPDDGSFRALVPAGNYALRVTASGFAPYDTRQLDPPAYYAVAIGADTPVGTITL
ncbi:MAG: DUF4382 domain-containing protein, partial [Armatimonadetes bacterium]|nr:DUF4382 domain-containing protein [Armatimonadota bacterium]